jgi:hypothetical protein
MMYDLISWDFQLGLQSSLNDPERHSRLWSTRTYAAVQYPFTDPEVQNVYWLLSEFRLDR